MTLAQLSQIADQLFATEQANLEWSFNKDQGFWWFCDNTDKPLVKFATKEELTGYVRCYIDIHHPTMMAK